MKKRLNFTNFHGFVKQTLICLSEKKFMYHTHAHGLCSYVKYLYLYRYTFNCIFLPSVQERNLPVLGVEPQTKPFLVKYNNRKLVFVQWNIVLFFCFPSTFTHFIPLFFSQFSLRGGEWWWLLLEEQYHEAPGTSYSDVQASGFEVVYDDAVLRSFLSQSDTHTAGEFEPKYFRVRLENSMGKG